MPYTSAAFAPCGVRTWCVLGAMVPLQGHDRTASTSTPKQPPAPKQRGQPDSSTSATVQDSTPHHGAPSKMEGAMASSGGLRRREKAGGAGGKETCARGSAGAAAAAQAGEHATRSFSPPSVLFAVSALMLLHGVVGTLVWHEYLIKLWDVEPVLALPQVAVLLLSAGLGLAGLLAAACAPGYAAPTTPAAPPSPGTARPLSLDELLAATHDYGKDLPEGVRKVAGHCEAHYPKHIVGQVRRDLQCQMHA